MFDHFNNIIEDFSRITDIDFSRRFKTLGEIKKIISDSKN